MLFKESLLNEFKRDKRPTQGCLTLAQHTWSEVAKHLNSYVERRAVKDAELMQNYLEWTKDLETKPKTFRIVRYDRLKLPKEN